MHVFLVHIAQDPHYLWNALLINIVDTISESYVKPNLIVLVTNKVYALTKKRPCPILPSIIIIIQISMSLLLIAKKDHVPSIIIIMQISLAVVTIII